MKWTDPNVKLIAAGASNFRPGVDWVAWNRTVLEFLRDHADYLAIHTYVGNPDNNFGDFLANSVDLSQRIKVTEGVIDGAIAGQTPRRKL